MQQKETINYGDFADLGRVPAHGRLAALDIGTKRIGVAVCDEGRIVVTPLQFIKRSSWKKLLAEIRAVLIEFDAKALVIGLPLESDGRESERSSETRAFARKFGLSLDIPIFLQDERMSSYEAKAQLWAEHGPKDLRSEVDGRAAAIILGDFLGRLSP